MLIKASWYGSQTCYIQIITNGTRKKKEIIFVPKMNDPYFVTFMPLVRSRGSINMIFKKRRNEAVVK